MIFNRTTNIDFIGLHPNLENYDYLKPKPYKNILPKWWTDVPSNFFDNVNNSTESTIRRCPGISDLFSNLYVIPMWFSANIEVLDDSIRMTNIETTHELITWSFHPKEQFLSHADIKVGDKKITSTIKIDSPWSIITPKGYSVLVMPPIYSFNENITPMPGIVDTDIFHELNFPTLVHSNNNKFDLKAGDPFVTIMPFKRTKYNMNTIFNNIKTYEKLERDANLFRSYEPRQNSYRKMQRDRDNKVKYNDKWIDRSNI